MRANSTVIRAQHLAVALAAESWTYERLKLTLYAVVAFAMQAGTTLAVVAIVYYGIRMAMARGDDTAFAKAKEGLTYSIIGAVLMFGAYTIIATIRAGVQSIGQ